MNKEKYIKEIKKFLTCDEKRKEEICEDIENSLMVAMNNGKTEEEAIKEMGEAKALAREFNVNLGLPEEKKSKKKIIIISVVILAIVIGTVVYLQSQVARQYEFGTSGIFNKETVTEVTNEIIDLMDKKAYNTIINDYSSAEIKASLTSGQLEEAVKTKGKDWGKFKNIQAMDLVEIKEKGENFAISQTTVNYENVSVIYTLSFNTDMELAGIFIK